MKKLRTNWLLDLGSNSVKAILALGKLRSFDDGDIVYGMAEQSDWLGGMLTGQCRITMAMGEKTPHVVHVIGPGFWFGETEFILGGDRIMEFTAVGEVQVLALQRKDIVDLAQTDADAWLAVARLTALNQMLAVAAADDLMIRGSKRRLLAVLLRFASRRNAFQGVPEMDEVPISQQELADAANVARSTAAKVISELAREGAIATGYRSIRILDARRLNELLESK